MSIAPMSVRGFGTWIQALLEQRAVPYKPQWGKDAVSLTIALRSLDDPKATGVSSLPDANGRLLYPVARRFDMSNPTGYAPLVIWCCDTIGGEPDTLLIITFNIKDGTIDTVMEVTLP